MFIISNFLTESLGDIAYEIQYICICKDNKKEAANAYFEACKANKHKATPEVREKDRKRKALNEANEKKSTPKVKGKDSKPKTLHMDSMQTESRMTFFKTAIKEGPYFICVVCNRGMYRKSVNHFDALKYDIEYSYINL